MFAENVIVAGTIELVAASANWKLLFGSNDATSIGSLKTTWTVVVTGTFVAALVGLIDTSAGTTRLIPVPVVNDWDGKLVWALPVMSSTPVTLMV